MNIDTRPQCVGRREGVTEFTSSELYIAVAAACPSSLAPAKENTWFVWILFAPAAAAAANSSICVTRL